MANGLGFSAAGARLPQQSAPTNTKAKKNIVYTNQELNAQQASKPSKMASLKSMLRNDEPAKRAPSVTSTSTEAPLLNSNGKQKMTYNTQEMMRGQFKIGG